MQTHTLPLAVCRIYQAEAQGFPVAPGTKRDQPKAPSYSFSIKSDQVVGYRRYECVGAN